jgi:hypothetical protein
MMIRAGRAMIPSALGTDCHGHLSLLRVNINLHYVDRRQVLLLG